MSPAVSETPSIQLWKTDRTCEELGGISPKTLFNITSPRGDLPCVRLGPSGRILRYTPEAVRAYIKRLQQASLPNAVGVVDRQAADTSAAPAE